MTINSSHHRSQTWIHDLFFEYQDQNHKVKSTISGLTFNSLSRPRLDCQKAKTDNRSLMSRNRDPDQGWLVTSGLYQTTKLHCDW